MVGGPSKVFAILCGMGPPGGGVAVVWEKGCFLRVKGMAADKGVIVND